MMNERLIYHDPGVFEMTRQVRMYKEEEFTNLEPKELQRKGMTKLGRGPGWRSVALVVRRT